MSLGLLEAFTVQNACIASRILRRRDMANRPVCRSASSFGWFDFSKRRGCSHLCHSGSCLRSCTVITLSKSLQQARQVTTTYEHSIPVASYLQPFSQAVHVISMSLGTCRFQINQGRLRWRKHVAPIMQAITLTHILTGPATAMATRRIEGKLKRLSVREGDKCVVAAKKPTLLRGRRSNSNSRR